MIARSLGIKKKALVALVVAVLWTFVSLDKFSAEWQMVSAYLTEEPIAVLLGVSKYFLSAIIAVSLLSPKRRVFGWVMIAAAYPYASLIYRDVIVGRHSIWGLLTIVLCLYWVITAYQCLERPRRGNRRRTSNWSRG